MTGNLVGGRELKLRLILVMQCSRGSSRFLKSPWSTDRTLGLWMRKLILEQRLSDLLSVAKEKEEEEEEEEDKPVNELEDEEVGAAASRDRDLDCVPTRLAHLKKNTL